MWRVASGRIAALSLVVLPACGTGGTSAIGPVSPAPPSATPAPSYPSYNTDPQPPDASGMGSSAMQLAARIRLGWNAGNTLEAIGGETAWGNPRITPELIAFVKASGFDAIRLPCSWDQYADAPTARIDGAWLERVRDVVQYCVAADLPVVLNVHWDGGWLENNVDVARRDAVAARQRAFWEQIATQLRDFDERLVFASANEPGVETPEQMAVLLHYHQTFVDAVRSTGGRNAYRVLVVQGPSTDVEKTHSLWDQMPRDAVPDRLMLEVHYYTPYQFTLMTEDQSWGRMFFYWGQNHHSTLEPDRNADWGEEDHVDRMMGMMRSKFVDVGIPVVLGEYEATRRTIPVEPDLHLASRAHWLEYVTRQALDNGLRPFYWDAGRGVLDRPNLRVLDPQGLNALLSGAGKR